MSKVEQNRPLSFFLRHTSLIALVWTAVISVSVIWNYYDGTLKINDAARIQARAVYDDQVVYRRWNSNHGGVYVPVSDTVRPSPYLADTPERDVATPSGRLLTLLTPASMMRQVYDLSKTKNGTLSHLIGLNPLNPANEPDAWERMAFSAIENGGLDEFSNLEQVNGANYMRLLRPLEEEKACLSCHQSRGLKEGETVGGISVFVPMAPLRASLSGSIFTIFYAHSALWLVGLLGIQFLSSRLKRSETQRIAAERELREHRDMLEETVRERTVELVEKSLAMEHQALHDALTGLPNRTLLVERALQSLQLARRENFHCSLLMMDLNRFKEVNDTLGHHVGDLLLKEMAHRLKHCLRDSDTLARLGGDEFAIMLPKLDSNSIEVVVKKLIKALAVPFEYKGRSFHVSASIGLAVFPMHGRDPSTLMKRADVAMYHAKRNKLDFAVYSQDIDSYSEERLALLEDLRKAIDSGDLELYYQPKLYTSEDRPPSLEALARWRHPVHGMIPPDKFIPLAEESGLINKLTICVLKLSTAQCAYWRSQGIDVSVSVNLSAHNFHDTALVKLVADLVSEHKLSPGSLILEITESMLMEDPLAAVGLLEQFQSLGLEISIDDFGTGYSSLSYLRQLPVDEVKIDRSFVIGMRMDEDDAVIVRAIIDLAHNLGLRVVAEGAEAREDWDMLCELGCDVVQGYYICRPLPCGEIEDWLRHPVAAGQ